MNGGHETRAKSVRETSVIKIIELPTWEFGQLAIAQTEQLCLHRLWYKARPAVIGKEVGDVCIRQREKVIEICDETSCCVLQ